MEDVEEVEEVEEVKADEVGDVDQVAEVDEAGRMADQNEIETDPGVPAVTDAADEPAPAEQVLAPEDVAPASAEVQAVGADTASSEAADAASTGDVPPGPSAEVKAVVEALIFASPDPIGARALCRMIAEEPKEDVLAALDALRADYENRPGLQLVEVAGGYQIVTRPELHEWVRRLFHERSTQKLTVQGLETLAVIAYKQPITALEIAEIRGVNTSGVLSTLLERHLIKIAGRKNVVGRPFLYATTKEFLIRFGLNDLTDLPKIEDMAEALGFDPPAGLIEQTPREDVLPLQEQVEEVEEVEISGTSGSGRSDGSEESEGSGTSGEPSEDVEEIK